MLVLVLPQVLQRVQAPLMIGAQVKQLRRAKKVRIRIVLETKLVSFSFIVARILVFIKASLAHLVSRSRRPEIVPRRGIKLVDEVVMLDNFGVPAGQCCLHLHAPARLQVLLDVL